MALARKNARKTCAALSLIVAAALTTSACQQQGGAPGAGSPPSQEALPNADYQQVDPAQLRDGGNLTFPISDIPANFNSAHLDGALVDNSDLNAPQLGGPVRITQDGGWEVDPDYAESVEAVQDDPTVVEVRLNPEAVWEDGTAIDVEDYVAFWKALNGSDKQFQPASTQGYEDIRSVEQGDDEHHVVIIFERAFADWPNYVGVSLPDERSGDPEEFNTGMVEEPMLSNGPFRARSVDAQNGVVVFERNERWWGATPKLDTITFRVVSQASQAQAFANREIDVVDIGTDGDAYRTAMDRADGRVYKSSGLLYTHLTMNATRGPLADRAVREAIGTALNRDVIGQAAVGPVEAPVVNVDNYVYMPGQNGYQDNSGGWLAQDPEAAQRILDDAGWAMDGDVRRKDGRPLELTIVVPADTQSNAARAQQVQKDLNAIGFRVELETVPSDKYFSDYVTPRNFDMVTFSWQGTAFPVTTSANLFHPADSPQNYFGITDDAIGEIYQRATSELDPGARIELANEMDGKFWGMRAMVPFYATPTVVGVSDDIANLGAFQFSGAEKWTEVGYTG